MGIKQEALSRLMHAGFYIKEDFFDKKCIDNLYRLLCKKRKFDEGIFLQEEDYLKEKKHQQVNPDKQFNFLNDFSGELDFIESDNSLCSVINKVLGVDYETVIKKAVIGVPEVWLPDWIRQRVEGINVANLGPYIKAEYRDITYFRGIDFHQDIIDWPAGITDLDPSTFLTLYIYLHEVTEHCSPLHILEGTHRFGATLFPHKLTAVENGSWMYRNDNHQNMVVKDKILTGGAGYVGLWHNCTLHGTQPVKHESERFRLSLRYLLAKSNNNKARTFIDHINDSLTGVLNPIRTRKDLNNSGIPVIKGNIINSVN